MFSDLFHSYPKTCCLWRWRPCTIIGWHSGLNIRQQFPTWLIIDHVIRKTCQPVWSLSDLLLITWRSWLTSSQHCLMIKPLNSWLLNFYLNDNFSIVYFTYDSLMSLGHHKHSNAKDRLFVRQRFYLSLHWLRQYISSLPRPPPPTIFQSNRTYRSGRNYCTPRKHSETPFHPLTTPIGNISVIYIYHNVP